MASPRRLTTELSKRYHATFLNFAKIITTDRSKNSKIFFLLSNTKIHQDKEHFQATFLIKLNIQGFTLVKLVSDCHEFEVSWRGAVRECTIFLLLCSDICSDSGLKPRYWEKCNRYCALSLPTEEKFSSLSCSLQLQVHNKVGNQHWSEEEEEVQQPSRRQFKQDWYFQDFHYHKTSLLKWIWRRHLASKKEVDF